MLLEINQGTSQVAEYKSENIYQRKKTGIQRVRNTSAKENGLENTVLEMHHGKKTGC